MKKVAEESEIFRCECGDLEHVVMFDPNPWAYTDDDENREACIGIAQVVEAYKMGIFARIRLAFQVVFDPYVVFISDAVISGDQLDKLFEFFEKTKAKFSELKKEGEK